MAESTRRVVITGIGIVSPIGSDRGTYWQSLAEGRGGIRTIQAYDTSGLPVHIGGEVADFDPKKLFVSKSERRLLRMMARTIQLAVVAANFALTDSGVDKTQLDPTRFGVEFGSGLIPTELPELADAARVSVDPGQNGAVAQEVVKQAQVDLRQWGTRAIENIPPLWMLKYLPNMLACHVSILHNAQGPNNTITESDVASTLALGEAYRVLERGQADFFLVGGAESKMNPLSMVRQCLFEHMSRRNEAPEKACRPFDRQRDGLVLGEGAAVLALEERAHALKRGARIFGEIVGFGASFDRHRDGAGIARAIRAALEEAEITPDDVDHINAHGLSTQSSDIWEARGLHEVFGGCGQPVPVFAPKSYVGNLGAGGGILELTASILALGEGLVPATLNYEEPDPECPVSVLAGEPVPVQKKHVVKINFTPMGQCAAVVIKRAS